MGAMLAGGPTGAQQLLCASAKMRRQHEYLLFSPPASPQGGPLPSEQAAWRLSLVLLTISFSLWAAGARNSPRQCTTATVAGKL